MSVSTRALLGVLVLACACSSPAPTPEPESKSEPVAASPGAITGKAPRATGGFPSAIVFTPEGSDERYPIPDEPVVLDQFNTKFHPPVLLARVGQTVQFKNSEDTLHNVHVIDIETRDTAFNVATPVTGAYEHVFDTATVYDVSCGIHPSMAAFVVVTHSPFAAVADKDGNFSLDSLPSGTYSVTVWNLDESRQSERVVTLVDDDDSDGSRHLDLTGVS